MTTRDQEEQDLRIDQMTINIEKMRFDIAETQRQFNEKFAEAQRQAERNQKWEARKFLVSALVAMAAAVGAGVALGNYITRHEPPPQPMFPPGTVITIPPAKPPQ